MIASRRTSHRAVPERTCSPDAAVAALYGLKLDDADGEQPLGRFIAHEIGGEPVTGDQVQWQGLTWTVATMEGNKIRKVGVKFPEGSRPGPALFL